jgi:hypothetical protein
LLLHFVEQEEVLVLNLAGFGFESEGVGLDLALAIGEGSWGGLDGGDVLLLASVDVLDGGESPAVPLVVLFDFEDTHQSVSVLFHQ